ncbi:hypothetical protein [Streptomyces xanthophaeus]
MRVVRSGRRNRGRTALLTLAVCGALALTGCRAGDEAGGPGTQSPAKPGAGPSGSSAPAPAPGTPSATAAAPKPTATAKPVKKPTTPPGPSAKPCDHKMPIAPDLIAVYRYTPEGGAHHLIVRHGNWGCGTSGADGAAFEPVGKETFYPVADKAAITAGPPVVAGPGPEKIGVQELVDWVIAHPDSGLPFRYHLGADGAIDTLEQVYLP